MIHPNKKRLRRSMMFLNCQKPGLIKDPYIYGPDSIMLDLEDAVAENQKDAARYSLYHAFRRLTTAVWSGWSGSTVWIPLTGRKISGCAWPEERIPSGSQRQRAPRMSRRWRSLCWRQRESSEGRREAPCSWRLWSPAAVC